MNNVIEIRNLYKTLGGKPILIDLSLSIPHGSLFGILGPNGAGKSTCLKLITGRLKTTSGSIDVLGFDPWKDRVPMFKKMGYLPQNPTPPADSRVLEYITYMGRLRGMKKKEAVISARDVLVKVGLEKFEGNLIGKLSGGEVQRLGFANSLLGNPEILILDEPTASLDPEGRVYVMDLIAKMAKDNEQTVIVSSHILPEIQRMTNHIAIMSEGKVLVTGNMRELTANVIDREYEIECSHPDRLFDILLQDGYKVTMDQHTIIIEVEENIRKIWTEVPKICSDNNFELRSLRPMRDALENVFLNYVSRQNRGNSL
ncbi:MAG: ABC transporter ATP-binding protein [Candidatus Heimdallarchaeota archaeon]|nr:ABC transporter ATP-binding protein [Candidatus Heimdallarchaeota archaeon]